MIVGERNGIHFSPLGRFNDIGESDHAMQYMQSRDISKFPLQVGSKLIPEKCLNELTYQRSLLRRRETLPNRHEENRHAEQSGNSQSHLFSRFTWHVKHK